MNWEIKKSNKSNIKVCNNYSEAMIKTLKSRTRLPEKKILKDIMTVSPPIFRSVIPYLLKT